MLTGKIPKDISMLRKLTLLNLNCNKIRGGIPKGIANLPSLQILYIWNILCHEAFMNSWVKILG